MKHTKEPWEIQKVDDPFVGWYLLGFSGAHIARFPSYANDEIQRIKLCVNSCAGIGNPEAIKELIGAAKSALFALKMQSAPLRDIEEDDTIAALDRALHNLKLE